MNNDWFFEKFALIADAPGAIERMRGLVLQLAVQGKLVPQDPSDEPAEVDHEAVVGTRENSTLKLTKIDSEAAAEDPVMPHTWMSVCLGDLVSIRTGFAFKSGDYTEHGTFILRVTNINSDGSFDTSNSVYLPDDKLDHKMRGYLLEEHELLVVMVGGSLGKIGLVTAEILPALLNQNMWRLKPYSDRLDFRFLTLVLYDLNENRLQITKSTHGHLAMGTYAAAKVPFPPLAEQKRIVAKVDELMGICDALEAQQQERESRKSVLVRASLSRFAESPTPENLGYLFHKSYDIPPSELRKSILTLAVQGKLVKSDSMDEPIDELLDRMYDRRQQLIDEKKIRKPPELPPVVEVELPFVVPVNWRWKRWGHICDWITYGFTRPMSHVGKGPPIVTAKNVQDGFMNFANSHRADSTEFTNLNPKDRPRRGDILITKDGTIGRAAIVDTDEPFCINQSVAVLWLESCLLYQPYMLIVIRSPSAQGPIWEAAEGMAIKHLSITDFAKMLLPIPPLAEQRRIVAKVDQLMALVDELERQQEASREKASKLLDAIVQEMTSGGRDIAATLET